LAKLKTLKIPDSILSGWKFKNPEHEPDGSKSISKVFFSDAARQADKLIAVVVFPTPPFPTAIAIIFLILEVKKI
jgi:hypothetical protein